MLNGNLIRVITDQMRKHNIYLIGRHSYADDSYRYHRMTRHCPAKKIFNIYIRKWATDDKSHAVQRALNYDGIGYIKDPFKFLCADDNPDTKSAYPLYVAFDHHDPDNLDNWYQLPSTKILLAIQHYKASKANV